MNDYNDASDGYDLVDGGPTPDPQPADDPNHDPGQITATSVFCVQCGYNLTGVAIGTSCPECGRTVAPSFHSHMLPTSGKAITSLVLGICSIPVCILYGIPAIVCGVLGIIFAKVAKAQVVKGEVNPSSRGMATAGLICGIIGLCLGIFYIGFFVVFLFSLRNP